MMNLGILHSRSKVKVFYIAKKITQGKHESLIKKRIFKQNKKDIRNYYLKQQIRFNSLITF